MPKRKRQYRPTHQQASYQNQTARLKFEAHLAKRERAACPECNEPSELPGLVCSYCRAQKDQQHYENQLTQFFDKSYRVPWLSEFDEDWAESELLSK